MSKAKYAVLKISGYALDNVILNAGIYKSILLFVTVCFLGGFFRNGGIFSAVNAGYVTTIMTIWGTVLLWCYPGKRHLYNLQNEKIIYTFLALCAIALIVNLGSFNSNREHFRYLLICFLIIISPGAIKSRNGIYGMIFFFFFLFIVAATYMAAVSLYSYLTGIEIVVVERSESVLMAVDVSYGRYTMFNMNPNITGMISFIALSSLIVLWVVSKEALKKIWLVFIWKIISIFLMGVHLAVLVHSDARGARYSFLSFVLLFSFLAFGHTFGKIRLPVSIIAKCGAAVLAAVIITGAVHLADYPVRVGTAMLKAAFTAQDDQLKEQNDAGARSAEISKPKAAERSIFAPAAAPLSILLPEAQDTGAITDSLEILYSRNAGFSNLDRRIIWMTGLEVIIKNPIFGTTPAEVQDAAAEVYESKPEEKQLPDFPARWGHLHNSFIQQAASYGLPAFICIMVFLVIYIKRNAVLLLQTTDSSVFMAAGAIFSLCAAILLWNQFEAYLFVQDVSSIIFWSGMGFCTALLEGT